MKILSVASALDLKHRLGCTPAWWQLFKALNETGNDVIIIPYLGRAIDTLWWRTYDNPCYRESVIFNSFLEWRKKRGVSPSGKSILSPFIDFSIEHNVRSKFKKALLSVLKKEEGIDCLLFMNVPINHMTGIPSIFKQKSGIPVIYYDGDMPTSLPKYAISRGFKFNYYEGANLSEYDAFLTNSEGCIPDLVAMGARNVQPFHYGIDPDLCAPVNVEKDIDISFYGHGSDLREQWMEKLITIPSDQMREAKFVVAGGGFSINLGEAALMGALSYSEWRKFCCRSRINLNITRWSHTTIHASSTSRPFELAAFGTCIVSQPYNGIEKWFKVGKELIVVNSEREAIESYEGLLNDEEMIRKLGANARKRVLKEHTFKHRARQLIEIVNGIKT